MKISTTETQSTGDFMKISTGYVLRRSFLRDTWDDNHWKGKNKKSSFVKMSNSSLISIKTIKSGRKNGTRCPIESKSIFTISVHFITYIQFLIESRNVASSFVIHIRVNSTILSFHRRRFYVECRFYRNGEKKLRANLFQRIPTNDTPRHSLRHF